ncbi:tumor necrosis factor ligand superfamily member 9 [Ascaphus truei]|uniref:tumor necrosis factor ligand superfamily member 9 n=1 Tax=Ascaphus truei TaxID=8439 RepID=UPI003F59DEF0
MSSVPPSVNSGDVESPGVSHTRCRSLDYCLVVSITLLALTVGALCALYIIWEKPLKVYSVGHQGDKQTASAHLVADNVVLDNVTLSWTHTAGVGSAYMSSDFRYDSGELVVGRAGLYYVYSQLTLTCVALRDCPVNGSASLTALKTSGDNRTPVLTLGVQLNNSSNLSPPTSFSGALQQLSVGDRLSARLWTDLPTEHWQMDQQENTFLGLFWVSGAL